MQSFLNINLPLLYKCRYSKDSALHIYDLLFVADIRNILAICLRGDERCAMLCASRYGDFNLGLSGACIGKHVAVAERMIASGATEFNRALWYACHSGSMEIVDLLINSKGYDELDFDYGLQGAAVGRKCNVIKRMVELGAKKLNTALGRLCCLGSQVRGFKDASDLLISLGADRCCHCLTDHKFY